MKTWGWAAVIYSLFFSGTAVAETWTVSLKAVNGRATYTHELALPVGKQTTFDGAPATRGWPKRGLIFHAYLNKPEDGLLRLDYMAELTGKNAARPPFQAAGKVALRPGKPVLAAEASGWKLILELRGEAGPGARKNGNGAISTSLKCGRDEHAANFAFLPDQQYTIVTYSQDTDAPRRFMVGLLPNGSGVDGTFKLQYTLQLKEGPETLAEGQGELILSPGGGKSRAAAGDCVFSAKAPR
jgi:hypothetical protein